MLVLRSKRQKRARGGRFEGNAKGDGGWTGFDNEVGNALYILTSSSEMVAGKERE
jgi:hypothetical protein